MKKKSALLCAGVLISTLCATIFTACENVSWGEDGQVYYWYGYENKKIYLDLVKNNVYVKFSTDATKEQFLDVVNGYPNLRLTGGTPEDQFMEGYYYLAIRFESDGAVPESVLKSIRRKDGVVSAEYMVGNSNSPTAFTDEFIVKLKKGTSYGRLQELAIRYDCLIGDENEFVEDQYMLYVSRMSDHNAMQTANIFYATGLFEFAEPNFIIYYDYADPVNPI